MTRSAAIHPLVAALAVGLALAIGWGGPAAAQETPARAPLSSVTTATITLPGDSPGVYDTPQSVTVTPDAVWITQHRAGRIIRVDPATHGVVATIDSPVPGCEPGACAGLEAVVATPRDAWVVNNQQRKLVHIDARTNRIVGTVPTNGSLYHSPVLDGDSLWTTVSTSGDVVRVSSRTNEIVERVHVRNAEVWPLAIVDRHLWVGSSADGAGGVARPMLHRIDLDRGKVVKTVRGLSGSAATVIEGDLWLSGCFWATRTWKPCPEVVRVDGRTGAREGAVDAGAPTLAAAADDDGRLVLVNADLGPNEPAWITVVDTEQEAVVATYDPAPADAAPSVAYGDGAFWLTDWTANTVARVVLP